MKKEQQSRQEKEQHKVVDGKPEMGRDGEKIFMKHSICIKRTCSLLNIYKFSFSRGIINQAEACIKYPIICHCTSLISLLFLFIVES